MDGAKHDLEILETGLRGWLLPGEAAVLEVERPADGLAGAASASGVRAPDLALIDHAGSELGRFSGDAARALDAALRGQGVSPLLALLARRSPELERLLTLDARPLAPPALLGEGRWAQLFVELTARCNERCAHCYASSSPERHETLDRATVEAVLRDAADLGFEVVQFTGGEALLWPELAAMAARARELGIPTVEVFTNGLLLSDRRYAELRQVGVAFAFSLYAADPAVHDAVTGVPGSHELTVSAIRRALGGGSPVRVGVIATRPEHESDALAAVRLARDLGVPAERVRLEVSRSVGRGEYAGREAHVVRAAGEGDVGSRPAAASGVEPAAAGEGGAHALVRGGKAAVLPDGSVTICIFSRDLVLGRVGPAGGLRDALERPAAAIRRDLTPEGLAKALRSACDALTCSECRMAATLLVPRAVAIRGAIRGGGRGLPRAEARPEPAP